MRVWRLCTRRHAAFDGEGARRHGGRWNPPGVAVVYTSATISLAALELFVHFDAEDRPQDLVVLPADLPDDLPMRVLDIADLPKAWRAMPAPPTLAALGAQWLAKGETAVLAAPSAIVPYERNYLLNPAHPDFARIARGRPESFSFDPRMWK